MALVVALLLNFLFPAVINGQSQVSVPTCNSNTQYGWAFNSLSQSPCLVAGNLGAVCSPVGSFEIDPITPSYKYLGPSLGGQNACVCSSVYYSLLSACAACQGAEIVPWSSWVTNCSSSYLGVYPESIPSGTAVPHWAYMNVSTSDSFNATLAKQIGDNPESTSVSSTTSSSSSSSFTSVVTATTTSSPSSPAGNSSNSKAGAIAGGVVGGLAFLCVLSALIFWFIHRWRRRSSTRPSSPILSDSHSDRMSTTPTPYTYQLKGSTPPPKVYDPSNPTTYPEPDYHSTLSHSNTLHPSPYQSMSQRESRIVYTGAPEI